MMDFRGFRLYMATERAWITVWIKDLSVSLPIVAILFLHNADEAWSCNGLTPARPIEIDRLMIDLCLRGLARNARANAPS